MNLAFPALLIFILILPGFIFNYTYNYIDKTQYNYTPFTQKTIQSILFAIILHAIWLVFAHYFFNYEVDYKVLLNLVTSHNDNRAYESSLNFVVHERDLILFYLLTIYFIPFGIGYSLRWIIDKYSFDSSLKFLRTNYYWYYYFKGYDFYRSSDLVIVYAIIVIAADSYEYTGILESFDVNQFGNLRTITLAACQRTKSNVKETKEELHINTLADYCTLPFSEIKILRVAFVRFEEDRPF
jgi:hypothetical protein